MREIFVKALEAIDALGRSYLLSALQLVIFAVGPITLRALAQAVAISDTGDRLDPDRIVEDPQSLVDDCAGLLTSVPAADKARYDAYWPKNSLNVEQWWEVVASENTYIVVPFHPSVSKFFRESQKAQLVSLEKYFGPPSATHNNLAKLCLGYLSIISKSGCNPESADYSFANYAAFAWILHIRESGKDVSYFQKLFPPWERLRVLVTKTMHILAGPDPHSRVDKDKDIMNWHVLLARQICASGGAAEESIDIPPGSPVSVAPSRIGSNWETVDAHSTSSFECVSTSDFLSVAENLESIAEDESEGASPKAPVCEACSISRISPTGAGVSRVSIPTGHRGPRDTRTSRMHRQGTLRRHGQIMPFYNTITSEIMWEVEAARLSLMPNIYRQLMLLHPYGYPLYRPEPGKSFPAKIRKQGVRVGDVGLVTRDGSFNPLFNVCSHSVNPLRLPDNFETIDTVRILARELFPPDTHLFAGGMTQTLGQSVRHPESDENC